MDELEEMQDEMEQENRKRMTQMQDLYEMKKMIESKDVQNVNDYVKLAEQYEQD